MAYSSIADVRLLGGFSAQEIDDATLASLIARAEEELLAAVAVRRRDEDLKPTPKGEWIDDVNRVFYLAHRPVADTNFDALVDASDLKIYAWTDEQDESTRTEVAVGEVIAETGRVLLAVAPPATVKKLTTDYACYLAHADWGLFRMASAFLAAYFAVLHLHARLPRRVHLPELTVFNDDLGQPFLFWQGLVEPPRETASSTMVEEFEQGGKSPGRVQVFRIQMMCQTTIEVA